MSVAFPIAASDVLPSKPAVSSIHAGDDANRSKRDTNITCSETEPESSEQCNDAQRSRGEVIAVVGAGGKVGCSTMATALVTALSQPSLIPAGVSHSEPLSIGGSLQPLLNVLSRRTAPSPRWFRGSTAFGADFSSAMLVDADRYGGGLDVLLGAEHTPGARWPEVVAAGIDVPAADLLSALPVVRNGVSLLSMSRQRARVPADIAAEVIATLANAVDVVVDLSRDWDGPVAQAVLPLANVVVVVMTTHVRSCASTISFLEQRDDLGVGSAPCVAAAREVPRGASLASVKRALAVPLVARIPHLRRLDRSSASDLAGSSPPRPLVTAARQILARAHG